MTNFLAGFIAGLPVGGVTMILAALALGAWLLVGVAPSTTLLASARGLLKAAGGFLRTPLGQVLALALVAVLALSWADARGYARGVKAERAVWTKRLQADNAKNRKVEAKNEKIGVEIGKAVAVEKVRIEYRTRTLIERIPYDVPPPADGWSLPVGFVRHHIESTSGLPAMADPAGRAYDAPSGVGLAELAEVDDRNAGLLASCRGQLAGWIRWWGDVSNHNASGVE